MSSSAVAIHVELSGRIDVEVSGVVQLGDVVGEARGVVVETPADGRRAPP